MKNSSPHRFAFAFIGLLLGGTVALHAQSSYVNPYTITTLAGTVRTPGPANSPGAQFELPFGIAVDSQGNVYVGDTSDDAIRKVTSTGTVTTLAGSPQSAGSANGTGSAALFNSPEGVAVDNSGNVYVADLSNNTIRMVTPAGVVTTLAGQAGTSGSANGTGTAAQFSGPAGVAVDSSGNVYVADTYNHTIRKISGGVVTTLAGQAGSSGTSDGAGSAARFYFPAAVAVDLSGNVYVADTYNSTIRKISPAGQVSTLAGLAGSSGSADGTGTGARFYLPLGIAVDATGNVYVADTYNNAIRMVTPSGVVTTLAGLPGTASYADGVGSAARFYSPHGVAVDGSGNIYISDTLNSVIRKGTVAQVAPGIQTQPVSQTINSGATVTFSVVASGAGSYQWQYNGANLSGANSALLVINNATSANGGSYDCVVTNGFGTSTSQSATLTVTTTANPGRLINLSMLSNISGSLSMGFVIGGPGTSGQEPLLIRAVGPSIGPGTQFNVQGVMPNPSLTLVQQSSHTTLATNSGWGSNQAAVTTADNATGAFPLTNPSSLDSAMVETLASVGGGYSATVTGQSGYALTEVYDDTPSYVPSDTRLINLSCLTQISGGSTLDVGFVIGGTTSKTVLIRASGPALAGPPFNVGGTMPDPQLQVSPLSSASTVLAFDAGWAGNAQIAATAAAVGAFAFPTNPVGLDSAVVVTLAPGAYTVQVKSTSGASGTVEVEIYDVP